MAVGIGVWNVGIIYSEAQQRWAIGWYVLPFDKEETRAGRKVVHAEN